MTLPPKLPARPYEPDPARARAILTTARSRRRAQAGAAGLSLAVLVGLGTLSAGGGATGLRPVDPAVPPSAPPTSGATPSAAPDAAPEPGPGGSGSPAPGGRPSPAAPPATRGPGGGTPTAQPSARPAGERWPEARVSRETVPYDATDPCDEVQHTSYTSRSVPGTAEYCLRYAWPATVAHGQPVTFHVDQCAVDADQSATWSEAPWIHIRGGRYSWATDTSGREQQTLRARTCWRWTVTWNALAYDGEGPSEHLPPGTYTVDVDGARAGEQSVASHQQDPNRQRTLTVR